MIDNKPMLLKINNAPLLFITLNASSTLQLMSRKSATIYDQGTIPEPSTPHIGKGGGARCHDGNSRVHIGQNPSDSSQSDKLQRNSNRLADDVIEACECLHAWWDNGMISQQE